jgi:hypothetical protein
MDNHQAFDLMRTRMIRETEDYLSQHLRQQPAGVQRTARQPRRLPGRVVPGSAIRLFPRSSSPPRFNPAST